MVIFDLDFFNPTRRTRQNTLDFKPPLPNALVQRVFRSILPYINGNVLKGLTVELDATSLVRLQTIKGERCLLLPNHPSEWDPCVLFEVGRRLNENFFYVAAREVFDYSYGLRGWFFQRLGVYSLVRGSQDRKSLKTSMDILSQNKGRLVIFVEGEISNQNETLLPLEAGVVQLAFMALNDAYKEGGKQLDALPSLYVCPVSLRYCYDETGLDAAIDTAVANLEAAVSLKSQPTHSRYERMKALAACVLQGAALQYGFDLNPEAGMATNVAQLSSFMLTKLEQIINLPPDEALSTLDRIRRIRNTVDQILSQPMTDEQPSSIYQQRLFEHQKSVLRHFYQDLGRVVNFIAVYDGYLQPDMNNSQYVELIRRLEKEVFGQFRLVQPRRARVVVAEPLDLKSYFPAFLENKRATVAQVSASVESGIFSGLQ